MKKILFLVIVGCSTLLVSAQPGKKGKKGEGREKKIEQLKTELSLSEAQVESIKSVNIETKKQMKENREKYSANKVELKNAQRELRKLHREKILALLDDQQKQKLKEIRKKNKPGKKQKKGDDAQSSEEDDLILEDN